MQYYFAYLKLYALFTLHVTSWGTRAGVGGPQAEKSPEEKEEEAKARAREMEEGFIDQKAKMERKRKIAEKSYWHAPSSPVRVSFMVSCYSSCLCLPAYYCVSL